MGGDRSRSTSSKLQVTAALDHEGVDSYTLVLTATDDGTPSKSTTLTVEVSVTNVDEAGVVTLSTMSPQAGKPITATLTDPDGDIRDVEWSWLYFSTDSDASRNGAPEPVVSNEFVPSNVLAGVRLQARALYNDGHDGQGTKKEALSVKTDPVAPSNVHEPEITGDATVSVAENESGTTTLGTYTTSDADGDGVTLMLTNDGGGPFTLTSSKLQVTAALDHEGVDSYTLVLTATDDGTPSKSTTLTVEVSVTNVDEAGVVTLSTMSPQAGKPITATLTDPDGDIRDVEWSWLYFSTDSDASRNGAPEPVVSNEFVPSNVLAGVRLQARALYNDGHDGQGTKKEALSVKTDPVAPSNVHEPEITGDTTVSVAENESGTTTLGTYTTSDADGDGVTLTLTNDGGGPFRLTSSKLQVTAALDHEGVDSYTLVLTATDDGTPSKSTTLTVEVEVTNVDEAGVVTLSTMSPQAGKPITATLTDPDGDIRDVEWSWLYFSTDSDASRNGAPEPVVSNEFVPSNVLAGVRLQARALYNDGHDGQGTKKEALSVKTDPVAPSNVHEPEITGDATVSVAENESGTTTLGTYTTSDADGDGVTLTLTNDGGGPFRLRSGALQVTSALDHESEDSYTLVLTATDDGTPSKSTTLTVEVSVTNVDEAGVVTLSTASPQAGKPITATLTDPDGDIRDVEWSWLYFSTDSDASRNGAPEPVVSNEFVPSNVLAGVRLQARALYNDGHDGQGTKKEALSVKTDPVAPSNVHEPEITGDATVSVAENESGTTTLGTYTTSDADGDGVTLTLTNDGGGPFRLRSGALQVTSALDHESEDSYTLVLTATDDGTPSKSTTLTVEVSVTNVDEAGVVTLSTASPQAGKPITATLTDPDGDIRDVEWSWLYFSTDSDASRNGAPEPVVSNEFVPSNVLAGVRLQARALYNDGHDGQGTKKEALSVKTDPVAPSNVHEPEITGDATVSVAENESGTTTLGTYTTSDADGDGVTLTLTNDGGGPFRLRSGALQVTSALDHESEDSYTLVLTATDDGTPSKSTTLTVEVSVTDVNEAGSISLSDTTPTVGDQLTATLTDPDGGLRGATTTWSFNDVSRSDESSDDQTRSTSLTSYRYTVEASDEGRRIRVSASYEDGHGSGKSATTTSGVVKPRPNRAPSTPSGSSSVSVAENTTSVASYSSSDPDGNSLTWSVSNSAFSISSSGSLRFKSAPNYESDPTSYTVGITTSDGSLSSGTKTVEVEVTNVDEAGSVSLSDTTPTVGDQLTATLTDPDGGLRGATTTWSFNDVSRSDESSDDQTRSTSLTSYRYTVEASDEGRRIRVSASYEDGHGSGKSATTTSGVVKPRPNRAPSTPSGSSSVSVAENTTSVASYSSSDPDGNSLTWSVSNSAFSISSSGSLRFKSAPNYESDPTSYTVGITTSDGSLSSGTKTVEVEVTNVDEAGSVSLSDTTPQVGDQLTASLSDPDGYSSGGSWRWNTFRNAGNDGDGEDDWSEDEAREADESWVDDTSERYAASSYRVRSQDVGRRLRAGIRNYTDGHGSGKNANSSLTSRVKANVPGAPPNFEAEPGSIYTQIDLSWGAAAANGSAITRYEYRYRKSGASSWSSWTSVGAATSVTVSSLDSGQTYNFEVRAVNGVGTGPESSTGGRVRTPPAKPVSLQAIPDSLAVVAAPNPFNPSTTLHLHLPMHSVVELTIYNIAGQVVRTLVDDAELDAGYHTIDWDGRNQQGQAVTSGVYLYRLRAGSKTLVSKLLLLQ